MTARAIFFDRPTRTWTYPTSHWKIAWLPQRPHHREKVRKSNCDGERERAPQWVCVCPATCTKVPFPPGVAHTVHSPKYVSNLEWTPPRIHLWPRPPFPCLPLPRLPAVRFCLTLLALFPVLARRGHLASHATSIPAHSSPAYPSSRVISFLSFFQFFRFRPAPPVIAILGPSRAETTDDFATRNKPKRIHRRIAANSNTHVGHGGPASVIPPHPGNLNTIRERPFPPACSTEHRQHIYRL